jgi:hypothetical protein
VAIAVLASERLARRCVWVGRLLLLLWLVPTFLWIPHLNRTRVLVIAGGFWANSAFVLWATFFAGLGELFSDGDPTRDPWYLTFRLLHVEPSRRNILRLQRVCAFAAFILATGFACYALVAVAAR